MEKNFWPELGVVKTTTFSYVYPKINNYMLSLPLQDSRDGKVREMLDFKTILRNPYRRCVGGYNRNINVFFLLAEAMWIVLGRRDVKTLVNFNSNMKNFSDDGVVFHAPYGWRLRHWGIRSEDKYDEKLSVSQGTDQVLNAIKLLTENPNTRQVVMSIWNPNFDLGLKTKDVPCNDMVMLKIRNNKLITTIQNRSNDLHWGLPTNIFQFSFLTEVMANCLGVELGTQTHNSQSLHIYEWNDISKNMNKGYTESNYSSDKENLYYHSNEYRMDMNFSHQVPANRFREVEYILSVIIDNLNDIADGKEENKDQIEQVASFSDYLYYSYELLKIYLVYKKDIHEAKTDEEKDNIRMSCIKKIEKIEEDNTKLLLEWGSPWDISTLAKNYFAARLKNKDENLGWLGCL